MSNAVEIAEMLTRRQKQALAILAKAEQPLRNKDFHERFEINGGRTTGWAEALGPCTKARDHDPASLWARGLVTVIDNCCYMITSQGREVAAVIGSVPNPAKVRFGRPRTDGAPSIGSTAGSIYFKPPPHPEQLPEPSGLPNNQVISTLDLNALGQRARAAVSCSYCFTSDREREWERVPRRPADRPDDVAFAPWFGRCYPSTKPRMAVMLLNPGHKAARHKQIRKDLGHQLRDGVISFEEYVKHLTPLVPEWGDGHVVEWLHAVGLKEERIAYLNMALCAVANDRYFPKLFRTCFRQHTRGMLECLKPDVVVLSGTMLHGYRALVESMGPKVVLSPHYKCRASRDDKKIEWKRVRMELKRLRC